MGWLVCIIIFAIGFNTFLTIDTRKKKSYHIDTSTAQSESHLVHLFSAKKLLSVRCTTLWYQILRNLNFNILLEMTSLRSSWHEQFA